MVLLGVQLVHWHNNRPQLKMGVWCTCMWFSHVVTVVVAMVCFFNYHMSDAASTLTGTVLRSNFMLKNGWFKNHHQCINP